VALGQEVEVGEGRGDLEMVPLEEEDREFSRMVRVMVEEWEGVREGVSVWVELEVDFPVKEGRLVGETEGEGVLEGVAELELLTERDAAGETDTE